MMSKFYCPACGKALGFKGGIDASNVLATTYQQDKHDKHTTPATSHRVQTVFDSTSTQYYAQCIDEAIDLGFVEIDDLGRKNVLFCPSTGSSIGQKYKWGQLQSQPDTVVVVKTSEKTGIHAFLEDSSNYSGYRCANCGGPLT